jgi:simple sugar transport system substrate-binding protein
MSPLGPGVSAEARKTFDATLAEVMAGKFSVFKGAMKDNKGNIVVAAGASFAEDAIELESMSYLVEGVVGSTA